MLSLYTFAVALPHEFDLTRQGDVALEIQQLQVELIFVSSFIGG